jgi:peptidoglycan/xylan/chitin deacetylase (PgdA/CDA1 family)
MKGKMLKIADSFNFFPLFNIFTKNRATVFMMHHFCAGGERDGISLPVDVLDKCLHYASDHGYSVIPLSEYVQNLMNRSGLYKTLVFTVDDGYRDFYEFAYPIFRKYDMPASVFLVSDFVDGTLHLWWDQIRYAIQHTKNCAIDVPIGTRNLCYSLQSKDEREHAIHDIVEYCKTVSEEQRYAAVSHISRSLNNKHSESPDGERKALSWDQIMEMQNHHIEFFPHTKTHPILSGCAEENVEVEISESKQRIESQLRNTADIFCYPNGRFQDITESVINSLKKCGYRAAVSAEEGFDHVRYTADFYRLRRYSMPDHPAKFKQLISGMEAFKRLARSSLKRA